MELPKILWLKNNMKPSLFSKCQFFSLPDFLTYRATNNVSRSTCSLTCCKTSYSPSGWHDEFFHQIGLNEIVENRFSQVGACESLIPGLPVGEGLSKEAAEELGLVEGTPVGSAIIDAYGVFLYRFINRLIIHTFFIAMQGGMEAWLLGTKRMVKFPTSFLLLKEAIDWQSLLVQVLVI